MIEERVHVSPSQKNFSPEKTVGKNRTQPTVELTVGQETVAENRPDRQTVLANRREGTVQGTVGANRPYSRPYAYRGGVYVKAEI